MVIGNKGSTETLGSFRKQLKSRSQKQMASEYLYAFFLMVVVTAICFGALPYIGYRSLGSVYLLAILIVASFAGTGPIFLAAGFAFLVWNFFFIPPTLTFSIYSWEDLMMTLSFGVAAVVGGLLTATIRRQDVDLLVRERTAHDLYEFTKRVSAAENDSEIVDHLCNIVEQHFMGRAHVQTYTSNELPPLRLPSDTTCIYLPMGEAFKPIGIFKFTPSDTSSVLDSEDQRLMITFVDQAAMAIERLRFAKEAETARVLEASEKLHQTLLNSISHELRTPITTLIGAASALKSNSSSPVINNSILLDEITRASLRLNAVVRNLLDMSRLDNGTLRLKLEWFEANDLFEKFRSEDNSVTKDRKLEFVIDDNIYIEGDFSLLESVMSNLLANAARYSAVGSKITVTVKKTDSDVRFLVSDEGQGIPNGQEHLIFEKFYRLPGSPSGGLGLGLSIVKNIVELHAGGISLSHNSPKGSVFEIVLPKKSLPQDLVEVIQ